MIRKRPFRAQKQVLSRIQSITVEMKISVREQKAELRKESKEKGTENRKEKKIRGLVQELQYINSSSSSKNIREKEEQNHRKGKKKGREEGKE